MIERPVHDVPARPHAAQNATHPGEGLRPADPGERALGDFTTTLAVLRLIPLSVAIGALAAGISLALLVMIGGITGVCYYGHWTWHLCRRAAPTSAPGRCWSRSAAA